MNSIRIIDHHCRFSLRESVYGIHLILIPSVKSFFGICKTCIKFYRRSASHLIKWSYISAVPHIILHYQKHKNILASCYITSSPKRRARHFDISVFVKFCEFLNIIFKLVPVFRILVYISFVNKFVFVVKQSKRINIERQSVNCCPFR